MQVHNFHCPYCKAALRIRDRAYVGAQVECPDCSKPLKYWLLMTTGLYSEAESFARRGVEERPFNHLLWQILVAARGNLGDSQGAVAAGRELVRLYPEDSGNAPLFLAWALPNAGRLEEARELVGALERILQKQDAGSMQRNFTEPAASSTISA